MCATMLLQIYGMKNKIYTLFIENRNNYLNTFGREDDRAVRQNLSKKYALYIKTAKKFPRN